MAGKDDNFAVVVNAQVDSKKLKEQLQKKMDVQVGIKVNSSSIDTAIKTLKRNAQNTFVNVTDPVKKAFSKMEQSIINYINKVEALKDTINLASKDLFLDTGYRDSIKVVQDYTEQIKTAEQEAVNLHKAADEAESNYTQKYETELAKRTEAAKKELAAEEVLLAQHKKVLNNTFEAIFPKKEDGEIAIADELGDEAADKLADFFKSGKGIKESIESLRKFIIKFSNESKVIPSSVSNTIEHLKLLADYVFESSGVLSEAAEDYKDYYKALNEDGKSSADFFNSLSYSAENLAEAFDEIKSDGSEKNITYFIKAVSELESYLFPKTSKKRSIASELKAEMAEEKTVVDDLKKSASAADETIERLKRKQGNVKSAKGIKDNNDKDYLDAQLEKFRKMLTAQKDITAAINGDGGTVAAVKELGSTVDDVYSKLKDLIGDAKNATEQVEEAKIELESVNGGTAEKKLENVIAEKAVTVKQLGLVLEAVETFLSNVQGLTKQIKVDGEKTTKLDRLAQEQLKYNAAIENADASKLKALSESLTSFAQNLTAVMTMINAAESALSGAEAAPVDAEKLEKLKAQASDLEVKVKPLATAVRGTISTFEKASKAASTFKTEDAKVIVDAGNTLLAVFKEYAKIAKQVKKTVSEIAPAGDSSTPQTVDTKVKILTKAQSDKGVQNVDAYKTAIADLSNAIDQFNDRNQNLTTQLEKQGSEFLKAAELAERYVKALGEKVKAEKAANANGVATNANKVTNSGIRSTADAIGKLKTNILELENAADNGLEDKFLNITTRWEKFVNLKEKPLSEYVAIRSEIAALSEELNNLAAKNKKVAEQSKETTDETEKQREEFEKLKKAAGENLVGLRGKSGSLELGLKNIDSSKEFVAGIQNDIDILKKFYVLIKDFNGVDSKEGFFAQVNELFNGTATGTKLSTFEEGIDDVRSFEQALQLLSIAYTQNMQVIRAHNKEAISNRSYEGQLRNVQQLILQIQRYLNLNKSVRDDKIGAQIVDLQLRLENLVKSGEKIDGIQFIKLQQEFNGLRMSARQAGLEGENLAQKIERIFGNRLVSQLSGIGINMVRRSLQDVYKNVVEIDYALTQVEIVTRASASDMTRFADSAAKAAKEIGASVTDIISSVETYARLGYSLNDSVDLATLTTKFSKLANTSADEATTGLTATMKAFGIEADALEEAADKIMVVSRDFPIDAKGIADAIQNGGAALNVAGNSLSQSLALIASGNAATQDPSSVGNAWKSVAARIRSATTELEEMGEEVTEIVGNTAKYRAEIMALTKTDRTPYGIDILDDAGNFRSTYEIITDIAEVFEDISSMNKAVLLEDLAGKRNASVVASALQNPDILKGAFEEAESAIGETEKAYQKYAGTVQYSLDRLNATFQSFSQNVLDSGLVKFFVDLANAILSSVDGLSNFLGSAGSLTAIGGTILGAMDARQVYKGGKIDVPAYACYDLKVA